MTLARAGDGFASGRWRLGGVRFVIGLKAVFPSALSLAAWLAPSTGTMGMLRTRFPVLTSIQQQSFSLARVGRIMATKHAITRAE